ncbi:7032_t:CDS:10 [Entrophospora sp. SA101]|nr:7032_t:CDS:10 [Entrophospora sp. SA101]
MSFESTESMKRLVEEASRVEFIPGGALKIYFRSANSLLRQAKRYKEENDLIKAYKLYMRYATYEFIDNREEIPADTSIYRSTRKVTNDFDLRALEDENNDAEALAQKYIERYGRRHHDAAEDSVQLPSQVNNLASIEQPNMFVVKCRIGRERDVVVNFLKAHRERAYSQHPIKVLSVTCRDALKGYVYVEAWRITDVQKASFLELKNIPHLYTSQVRLVPLAERNSVLIVKKPQMDLKEGSWVKIRKGKFAGDLAQVTGIYEDNDVKVKVIPRIDVKDDKSDKSATGNLFKRKRAIGENTVKIFNRGHLELDFKLTNLIWEGVSPSMDEITEFLSANESNDTDEPFGGPVKTNFQIGDEVIVVSGADAGVYGVVELINKEQINVRRTDNVNMMGKTVSYNISILTKRFVVGDYVQVLNGKNQHEMGMVINVDKSIVTILSDMTRSEITAFSKDLKKVSEITNAKRLAYQYELHDLVLINIENVKAGVIIGIESNLFRIIGTDNIVRSLSHTQIIKKEESKPISVFEKDLKVGDYVREIDGERREGKILQLFRQFAFLINRSIIKNGGVFVVGWRRLENKSARSKYLALDKLNPDVFIGIQHTQPAQQPQPHHPYYGGSRGRGGYGKTNYYNRSYKDPLVSETVTIIQGPYKGYLGIVKEATETFARVELHTNCQIVNVKKELLHIIDKSGKTRPVVQENTLTHSNRDYSPASSNYSGTRTPSSWSSSHTPTWSTGSISTNNINDGSRTPSHHIMDGSRTPAVHSNTEGSKTPAWDLGSKTPAYGAVEGSKTPAWDIGSKTPANNDGSRTPAWNANAPLTTPAAETPHFYAATPAAETPIFNPPTPAVVETPGTYFASTPGNTTTNLMPATPAPIVYTPAPVTPGPGPLTPALLPQTPYASNIPHWLIDDVAVTVSSDRDTGEVYQNGIYNDLTGRVMKVETNGDITIELVDRDVSLIVNKRFLEPVTPHKKDMIKLVCDNELKYKLGVLVGVDGDEGVVKVKGGKDFKIVSMQMMVKYVGPELIEC